MAKRIFGVAVALYAVAGLALAQETKVDKSIQPQGSQMTPKVLF